MTELWVHRNKGTWRDIRSVFALHGPARARLTKPREVSAGPLPLTRPRHGRESACSISLTCQTTNSAMSSTPPREVSCVKQRRFQGLPSGKKLNTSIQCQSGHVAANTFVRRTGGFIERTQAGPLSAKKTDLMSRHLTLLRWTQNRSTEHPRQTFHFPTASCSRMNAQQERFLETRQPIAAKMVY